MEDKTLRPVYGNTWVLEASELIPVYFLNEEHTEAILLDSGLAVPDREMLEDWIRALLGLLGDGRSYTREEVIRLMWTQLDLRIHDGMKMLIFDRNLKCLLQYLTDSGRLEREYSQGVAAYRKTGLFPG